MLHLGALTLCWLCFFHITATGCGGIYWTKRVNAGIRIFCTEERSQGKNRERAMAILRSRLFALEQEKQQSEIAAQRKSQVW